MSDVGHQYVDQHHSIGYSLAWLESVRDDASRILLILY